ncbi:hypothetical protein POM88_048724 [Heracleum sosnowskyi]|uniref:Uncharacterized protein n=1 Tax=Heracleum sosnowskyi TaxID=360622 RepID=A0AAD8GWU0_9APIA|nr:hypothetical protein POM88_048724 [Heracleum sosnowskyi]
MGERSIILHQNHSDEEEDEETLSLCDLPINSEIYEGLLSCNYSKGDHTPSSLDAQTDHFEFYNDEWSSLVSFPADNILFCGKLIVNKGYKQSVVSETTIQHTQENSSVLQQNLNEKGKCMNKENGSSFIHAPSSNSVSTSSGINNPKNDVLAHRITILKPPTRSRWFVFLFKSTRIPTDTETREKRQTQNKKITSQQSQVVSGKITGSKSRGIRWWKLIRVLGCDNLHHADAVIKSSYSSAPLIRE